MTARTLLAAVLAAVLCGCGTQFMGEAHYPGGVPQCRKACEKEGLEMAAYMYLGEYTTGCVCRPPKASSPDGAADADETAELESVAAAHAVAVAFHRHRQDNQAIGIALGVFNLGTTLLIISGGSGESRTENVSLTGS